MFSSLPTPPVSGIPLGPLRLHVYGLLIAAGIASAVWLSQRRWEQIGGVKGMMSALALWGVPGGLVGARAYSLITSWQVDTGGDWYRSFFVWQGGLGIWGGISGGVALGYIGARRRHLRLAPLLDTVAPGLILAQAIGRWGNYFNQELYGGPTSLPWAVRIDPAHRAIAGVATYQPTFLYESIWDLVVCGLLILAGKRLRIRRGYLFALYVALYTAGRFWTEYLRIDHARKIGPLRINDWVSLVVFVTAAGLLMLRGRRPRRGDELVGERLRPGEPGSAPTAGAGASAPAGTGGGGVTEHGP